METLTTMKRYITIHNDAKYLRIVYLSVYLRQLEGKRVPLPLICWMETWQKFALAILLDK